MARGKIRLEAEKALQIVQELRESRQSQLDELRGALTVFERIAEGYERDIRRYDELLEEIAAGGLKLFGQIEEREPKFAGMSIADVAFEVIRDAGRPLHVKEIWEEMRRGGKELQAKRPTVSIAAALLRDSRFENVGRNTFTIAVGFQERLPGTD